MIHLSHKLVLAHIFRDLCTENLGYNDTGYSDSFFVPKGSSHIENHLLLCQFATLKLLPIPTSVKVTEVLCNYLVRMLLFIGRPKDGVPNDEALNTLVRAVAPIKSILHTSSPAVVEQSPLLSDLHSILTIEVRV